MALAYRDFSPRPSSLKAAGRMEWEPLSAVVERVNQWLAQTGLHAMNIETLLLPVTRLAPLNSNAGGMAQRWDEDHALAQVVRVWYELPPAGVPAVQPAVAAAVPETATVSPPSAG
jgi:hypothetical protein